MKEEYRQLLVSCDEAGAYEFPSGFDSRVLERDARQVNDILYEQRKLSTKFEGSIYNQDASFSVAISLLDYAGQRGNVACLPTIRFSNFGRLVTLTMPDMVPEDLIRDLPSILRSVGFHFIPSDVLDVEYDGVMRGGGILPTWWIRYFDWL